MTGTFWPLNAAGRLLAGYQTTIWRNFPPNNSGNQCRWKCGLPKLMWAISSINQFELNFLATPCHSAWKTVMVCDKCRWHSGQPKVGLKPIWLWSAQLSNVTYCECVLWTESNKRYGRCHCNWTPQHRSNEWAVFFFSAKTDVEDRHIRLGENNSFPVWLVHECCEGKIWLRCPMFSVVWKIERIASWSGYTYEMPTME